MMLWAGFIKSRLAPVALLVGVTLSSVGLERPLLSASRAAAAVGEQPRGSPPTLVDSARDDLARLQRGYVEWLADPAAVVPDAVKTPVAPEIARYVYRLRSELRNAVVAQLAASAEVEIAVARAAIRTLEERIAAYEYAYGRSDGVPTSRWSVLSEADLATMQDVLQRRLRMLLVETAGLPDASVPLHAQGRLADLKTELRAIEIESLRRVPGALALMTISDTPTAANAERAVREVGEFELTAEFRAERALTIEIELRKAWMPSDPALAEIKQKLHSGPNRKAIVASVRGAIWNKGWPPGRGPPPGHARKVDPEPVDPSRGGGGAAVSAARKGVADEIDAMTRRDALARADAAARLTAATDWLNTMTGQAARGFEGALASLSRSELDKHAADLETWKVALRAVGAADPTSDWRMDMEINDVDARLKELRFEIMIRGPPPQVEFGPRGPEAVEAAVARSETAGGGTGFADYNELSLERRRMIELQARFEASSEVDRVALQEAIVAQKERLDHAERVARDRAGAAAAEAERAALIHGRGSAGALGADYFHVLRSDGHDGSATRSAAVSVAEFAPHPTETIAPREPTVAGRRVTPAEAPEQFLFDRRFTRETLNSAEAFRSNPSIAPGGVVVDLTLPESLAAHLAGVAYDAAERRFQLRFSDGSIKPVDRTVAPQAARAALGFIHDGRVAAVDIGGFDVKVQLWMAESGLLPSRPTRGQIERMLRVPNILKVVRYNPALADTGLGLDLVGADEIILDLVSFDPELLASKSVYRGIDTREAHHLVQEDLRGIKTADGYKSILTVDALDIRQVEGAVHVEPRFDYAVYALPRKLERVSAWFAAHDAELRSRSPELRALEEFAVAVAVLRTAQQRGLLDGIANLGPVLEPGDPTPSLLCRGAVPAECDDPFFRELVAVTPDFPQPGER